MHFVAAIEQNFCRRPLTPILYLARRNASRVPVLGSGWENLVILADSVRCITICRQLLDTA